MRSCNGCLQTFNIILGNGPCGNNSTFVNHRALFIHSIATIEFPEYLNLFKKNGKPKDIRVLRSAFYSLNSEILKNYFIGAISIQDIFRYFFYIPKNMLKKILKLYRPWGNNVNSTHRLRTAFLIQQMYLARFGNVLTNLETRIQLFQRKLYSTELSLLIKVNFLPIELIAMVREVLY
jgi:hypothetical protein